MEKSLSMKQEVDSMAIQIRTTKQMIAVAIVSNYCKQPKKLNHRCSEHLMAQKKKAEEILLRLFVRCVSVVYSFKLIKLNKGNKLEQIIIIVFLMMIID